MLEFCERVHCTLSGARRECSANVSSMPLQKRAVAEGWRLAVKCGNTKRALPDAACVYTVFPVVFFVLFVAEGQFRAASDLATEIVIDNKCFVFPCVGLCQKGSFTSLLLYLYIFIRRSHIFGHT